jgi:hypothetical protein
MPPDLFNDQLEEFCENLLTTRKYQFQIDELTFHYDELVTANILEIQGTEVRIKDNGAIIQKLFPKFKQIFSYEFSDDPSALKDFLKLTEGYFGDGVLMGRTAFNEVLIKTAILGFVNECNGNLLSLAKTFSKADRTIYIFQRGFTDAFPKIDQTVDEVIELFEWLYDEVKVDQPGVLDGNTIQLGHALRIYCSTRPEIAIQLYQLCILADRQLLKAYHPTILTACYNHDPNFLAEIKKLTTVADNQGTIVCALGSVDFSQSTPIQLFIEIIERIVSPTEQCLQELPRFYCNLLEHIDPTDKKKVDHCFDAMMQLTMKYPQLLGPVLFQFRFIKGYYERVYLFVAEIIDTQPLPENFTKLVGEAFTDSNNSEDFFKILRKLALKITVKFDAQDFKNNIYLFHHKFPAECDQNLIKLMIDDEGIVRFAGMRLLFSMSMVDKKKNFSNDLLSLSAMDQYKLAIALTDDFHEPKYIVPLVAPLLNSSFSLVRDLVLHRLEIMSENYFTSVEKAMIDCLDQGNSDHNDYIERVKLYTEEFDKRLRSKLALKELDPRYTQSRYYRQFFQESNRTMQENLDKSVKENTLLSILGGKDVMLAKGGGFVMGERTEVQQLGVIRTEMTLPREYFLSPEMYDWEHRQNIFENRKDLYNQWEAMISS